MVEFLNDVEILVRLTAIEGMLEIFDILEDEHIENDFIPVIKLHLNLDLDETCNYRMSKQIGKIIFNLQSHLEPEVGVKYFKQLVKIKTQNIKLNVCYNIPGFYYLYNSEDIDFFEILKAYATDKDALVRMQIAKGFHEIVSINSKGKGDSLDLKDIFFTLLTDEDQEIAKVIIKNMDEYLNNFFNYDDKDMTPNSRDSTGTENESEKARLDFYHE